jgi:dephospho-CoA kinase
MSRERLDEILRQQMPDAEKRQRADFVVPTGLGKRASRAVLARILQKLKHG